MSSLDAQVPTQPVAASESPVEAEGQEQQNNGVQKRIDELTAKAAAFERQVEEQRMRYEAQLASRDELLKTVIVQPQQQTQAPKYEAPPMPENVDPAIAAYFASIAEMTARKTAAQFEKQLEGLRHQTLQTQHMTDRQQMAQLTSSLGLEASIKDEADKVIAQWRARGVPDVSPEEAIQVVLGQRAFNSQRTQVQTQRQQAQFNANAGGFIGSPQAAPPNSVAAALPPLPDDYLNHVDPAEAERVLRKRLEKQGYKF